MQPVFLVIEGREAMFSPNYFFREDSNDDMEEGGMQCEDENDSDTEGRTIDYPDSESESTASTYDNQEEEFLNGPSYLAFLDEITVFSPEDSQELESQDTLERKNALEISRLNALLSECVSSAPKEEVEAEEDYITSIKFNSGDKAIVVSSMVQDKTIVKYSKNPMHISTVQEILNSGNCRNPCDNNPMCAFTLVTVKT